MMQRLIVGGLVAGIVMWLLGYVFYGLLFGYGWASAPESVNLAIQSALKALPGSGQYIVPGGDTPAMVAAYQAGPIAEISYNVKGFAMFDPASMFGGLFHFIVVATMVGLLIRNLGSRGFGDRARVVVGLAATAVVYIHLAGPIWYHGIWRHALFLTVADFVILTAGGLIMARWFVRPGV
jgi:hypothetical protein